MGAEVRVTLLLFAPIAEGDSKYGKGNDNQRERVKQDGQDSPAFHDDDLAMK